MAAKGRVSKTRRATSAGSHAGRDQPRGQREHLGRGRVELERAGVGGDADVQAGGDVARRAPRRAGRAAAPTTTAVAAASGSTRRTEPKPGLDAWWSSTIQCGAASSAGQLAEPARAGRVEAHRRVSGSRARPPGGTSRSRPGRNRNALRAPRTAPGTSPARAVKPSWRRPSPKPSMLPSASPSGLTWQSSSTAASRGSRAMTSAARANSASAGGRVLGHRRPRSARQSPAHVTAVPALVERVAASSSRTRPGTAARRRRSVAPAASSCTFASDSRAAAISSSMCLTCPARRRGTNAMVGECLSPSARPTVLRSRPLALSSAAAVAGLLGDVAEHGVEDRRLPQVRGDPRVGDGDHAEPGVLDLGPDDLRHQFPHPLGVPAHLGRICHLLHLRSVRECSWSGSPTTRAYLRRARRCHCRGCRRRSTPRSVILAVQAPPGGEHLHLRPAEDQPLARVEHLADVGGVGRDDRDADLGPPVQVQSAPPRPPPPRTGAAPRRSAARTSASPSATGSRRAAAGRTRRSRCTRGGQRTGRVALCRDASSVMTYALLLLPVGEPGLRRRGRRAHRRRTRGVQRDRARRPAGRPSRRRRSPASPTSTFARRRAHRPGRGLPGQRLGGVRPVRAPRGAAAARSAAPLDRFDDDLVTIQKYPGKTNEQFTKLLLNVTLLASASAGEMLDRRLRVLDPLCGRGTTLNQALTYGYDAAGLDLDGKDFEAYAASSRPISSASGSSTRSRWARSGGNGRWSASRLTVTLAHPRRTTGPAHAARSTWCNADTTTALRVLQAGDLRRRRGRRAVRRAARQPDRRRRACVAARWTCSREAAPVWARLLRPGGAWASPGTPTWREPRGRRGALAEQAGLTCSTRPVRPVPPPGRPGRSPRDILIATAPEPPSPLPTTATSEPVVTIAAVTTASQTPRICDRPQYERRRSLAMTVSGSSRDWCAQARGPSPASRTSR